MPWNLLPVFLLLIPFLVVLVRFAGSLQHRLAIRRAVSVERRHIRVWRRFRVDEDRFKLTQHRAVKTILSHDHAIWTYVDELAKDSAADRATLRQRVYGYIHEIVPYFHPTYYYRVGRWLAQKILQFLYKIDANEAQVEYLKRYARERPRSMVYLANHRSNTDYVLLAYALAENVALSFAVGEWARVWPLEYLFKKFGSYFLRRGYRDSLYHTVLCRYVQLITKNGVTQALFPEGKLTRDGRFLPPRIGLLDYIICSKADRTFARELVFVPVAINYDRVLEDRNLVREQTEGRRTTSRMAMCVRVVRILFHNTWKYYRRRLHKHGMAVIRFGAPVSFDRWLADLGVDIFSLPKYQRRAYVARFMNEMMARIARLMPVTPLCLVAHVLLQRAPIADAELRVAVRDEIGLLQARGAEVVGAAHGVDWIVDGALLRFNLRHLVRTENGMVAVVPEEVPILQYYANAIAHFYDEHIPVVEKPPHLRKTSEDPARVFVLK